MVYTKLSVIEVQRYKAVEKYEREMKDRIRWSNIYRIGIPEGEEWESERETEREREQEKARKSEHGVGAISEDTDWELFTTGERI